MLTFTSRLPHAAAATLRLLLVGVLVAISATARAQVVVLPNCNFQEVDLMPCMGAASAGSAGVGSGNISDACCSSLSSALDAGHRCVCSLLLSNGVFTEHSLGTSLLTLPLVLPLPGCFLYAPSLAACQARLMQQTSAPLAAAAITGGSAGAAALPLSAQAAATPRVNKHAGREQSDDDRRTRGSAAPSAAEHVISHSDVPRSHSSDKGRSSMLTFAVAMAVFWFNSMTGS